VAHASTLPLREGRKTAQRFFGEGYVVDHKHANRLRRRELKQRFAAQLRINSTEAERRLWAILRDHRLVGLRFRRQQPIGPYIVDFYCSQAKLVVELDGDQHGSLQAILYDEARTRWLMTRGYIVLRFPNRSAFGGAQEVVDTIVHVLEEHDTPLPEICSARTLRFSPHKSRPSLKGRVVPYSGFLHSKLAASSVEPVPL
jgi:very-short-patch-repair endonuclease